MRAGDQSAPPDDCRVAIESFNKGIEGLGSDGTVSEVLSSELCPPCNRTDRGTNTESELRRDVRNPNRDLIE